MSGSDYEESTALITDSISKLTGEMSISEDIVFFQQTLLKWFENNGRHYPWRKETDPFKILIAEMMLQRTKADQVLPVYIQFISKWKDAKSLSSAGIDEISAVFAKLGLQWRSKFVLQMAKRIRDQNTGKVPALREELLDIPGVGDYIADTMLVFAFKKRRTIVDSNVVRLLTRFFGLTVRGEMRKNRDFVRFCQSLTENLQTLQVKNFNWSLLDHSFAICKPMPRCEICPLSKKCSYFEKHRTS